MCYTIPMSEYPSSLLEYVAKTYKKGLWAGDILRMADEGLNPANIKDQDEYIQRAENGTLRPIEVEVPENARAERYHR